MHVRLPVCSCLKQVLTQMLHRKAGLEGDAVKTYMASTSTTSLHPHLEKHHLEEYMAMVKEQRWTNQLPGYKTKSQLSSNMATSQGERHIEYNEADFHQLLLKFIVVDDQVCSHHFVLTSNMLMQTFQSLNVIECPEFHELFNYLRPDIRAIPHRTKLRELVINSWRQHFQVLKSQLAVGAPQPSRCFHLTFLMFLGGNGPGVFHHGRMVGSKSTILPGDNSALDCKS
jgi:hypothetical protein